MYVSTAWSMVKAYDAASGKVLWSYDPEVPRELGVNGCCDVVNRGVAAWDSKIYVGTFDGRLVALDARNGKPRWSVRIAETGKPFTSTQAPRVVKGRVLIGISGGECGIRGYISAYDAQTGALAWRFGIKLHAQDTCNLLYATWHIQPDSRLAVSIKRNPGQHTHAQCGASGYRNGRHPGSSIVNSRRCACARRRLAVHHTRLVGWGEVEPRGRTIRWRMDERGSSSFVGVGDPLCD